MLRMEEQGEREKRVSDKMDNTALECQVSTPFLTSFSFLLQPAEHPLQVTADLSRSICVPEAEAASVQVALAA